MTQSEKLHAAGRPTIVIPTRNRPDALRECLLYLSRQQGGPYRTIVVDDGGDSPAAAICAPFEDWVSCVRQDNRGPGRARNAGVAAAPDDALICFLDDDCRADPDWVRLLAAAQGGTPMRLVGGRIDNALPDNPFSSASQAICGYLYDFYERSGSRMRFFTTNNMCLRAQDFRALGGFGADFPVAAEDRDFSMRWAASGGTFRYCPDARVGHAHAMTLRQFWHKQASYGRGAHDLHRHMTKSADRRRKFESPMFYVSMLTYPLRRPGRARLLQSLLVGLSHVALLSGYLAAAWRQRQADDR